MKAIDIREMTDEERAQQYRELSTELFHLRMQQTLGQLEKASRIREVRRDIARVQTVINEVTNAGDEA